MRDDELDLLHNAELKEAFDEFDKVEQFNILILPGTFHQLYNPYVWRILLNLLCNRPLHCITLRLVHWVREIRT